MTNCPLTILHTVVLYIKIGFLKFLIFLEDIPSSFKNGIILPVYKGKGKDPLLQSRYQGITLTSILAKTFEFILLDRLLPPSSLIPTYPSQHKQPIKKVFHASKLSLPVRKPLQSSPRKVTMSILVSMIQPLLSTQLSTVFSLIILRTQVLLVRLGA